MSASNPVDADGLEALQQALAGEHAAVYAYGLIAGRLDAQTAPQERAAAAFEVHRRRRDDLIAILLDADQPPVDPEAAYVTGRVRSEADAQRLAREVESGLCRTWGAVVAASDGSTRRYAISALDESAAAVLEAGGDASAFPGLG